MGSGIEFLDLNDDCLLELFGYLSAEDLCSLKQTNQRLWHLVDYYFQTVYSVKECEVAIKKVDGWKLEEILKYCGKFTRKLLIESPRNYSDMDDFYENECTVRNKYIGDLIATHCTDKLQKLRFDMVYLSGFCESDLQPVLQNVDTLELRRCCGNAEQFVNRCSNVRTIVQKNCGFFPSDQHYLLQNEHFQLKSLIIENENETDLTTEVLVDFFEIQRNLKQFQCINRFSPAPPFLVPLIVRSAINLEELSIELETFSSTFTSDLRSVLLLDNLKRLEFNTDEISIITFFIELAAGNKLECFGISDVCLDDIFCNSMIKMTNLKTIKLISPFRLYDDFFKAIAMHLHNLEEIYLVQCEDINFGDLMAFVENLYKLKKMFLYENTYIDWNATDGFVQFTIDFVHLYKIRTKMVAATPITICFDSSMFRKIEEYVWPDELEWCRKNELLQLTLADDDYVKSLPGFYSKID